MTVGVVDEAEALSTSWQLALRAQRKSRQTLKGYGDGPRVYLSWCSTNDAEPMRRSSLSLFTAQLLDSGAVASTARSRQLAVLDERVVEPLTDDGLRALLKTDRPADVRVRSPGRARSSRSSCPAST